MSTFTVSAGLATYTGFRAVPQVRLSRPASQPPRGASGLSSFQGLRVLAVRRADRAASTSATGRRTMLSIARFAFEAGSIRIVASLAPAGTIRGPAPRPARARRAAHLSSRPSRVALESRALTSPSPTPPEQKASAKAAVLPRVGGRSARLNVHANKRVAKKANVVLTQSVDKLGNAGDLVEVSLGFFRNHLEPMGKAKKATAEILAEVEASAAAEVAAKNAESAGAKAIATALKTIGKFVVKKTVGEDGKIFGSVTAAEVADAVEQQTGKALDKKAITVPDISEVGTYDITVKLHPEVTGEFQLEVQKA